MLNMSAKSAICSHYHFPDIFPISKIIRIVINIKSNIYEWNIGKDGVEQNDLDDDVSSSWIFTEM